MTEYTGKHLKELREVLGFSLDTLCDYIGMRDKRSMRRWHHSEWVLSGNSLIAVKHYFENGRNKASAEAAVDLWRSLTDPNARMELPGIDFDPKPFGP